MAAADNYSDCHYDDGASALSSESYLTIGIYLCIVGVLALIGNVVVLALIVYKKQAIQKFYNVLLANLALADLLQTLTAHSLTAASSFRQRWLFGDDVCTVVGFSTFALTLVSLNTQCFMAVFRYIFVCKPSLHHLVNLRTALRVVVVSWLYAAFWALHPLLGWNAFSPEPFGTSCTVRWAGPGVSGSYIVATDVACYALPLAVAVTCYLAVLRGSLRMTFGTRTPRRSCSNTLDTFLWRHREETERGVTRMCVAMMTVFSVCYLPYVLLSLLSLCGTAIPVALSTLPTMFARLSTAVNPVIYCFMSTRFRQGVASVLPRFSRHGRRVGSAVLPPTDSRRGTFRTESPQRKITKDHLASRSMDVFSVGGVFSAQTPVF